MVYGILYLASFVAIFVINQLFQYKIVDETSAMGLHLILYICWLIDPFLLAPMQKTVNDYTTEKLKKPLEKGFMPWKIAFIVMGFFFNIFVWCGNSFIPHTDFP